MSGKSSKTPIAAAIVSAGSTTTSVRATTLVNTAESGKGCSRCGQTKPAFDFNLNKSTSSGLTSHCKNCIAAAASERKKRKLPVTEPTVEFKVCGHCRCRKRALDFHRTQTRNDGLASSCKACRNSANIASRAAIRRLRGKKLAVASCCDVEDKYQHDETWNQRNSVAFNSSRKCHPAVAKVCEDCQVQLPASQFADDARKLDGLRDSCQTCRTAQMKSQRKPTAAKGVTKQCRKCGTHRTTSEFHRQLSRADGLYSYCIFCASSYKLKRKALRAKAVAEAAAASVTTALQDVDAEPPRKRGRGMPRQSVATKNLPISSNPAAASDTLVAVRAVSPAAAGASTIVAASDNSTTDDGSGDSMPVIYHHSRLSSKLRQMPPDAPASWTSSRQRSSTSTATSCQQLQWQQVRGQQLCMPPLWSEVSPSSCIKTPLTLDQLATRHVVPVNHSATSVDADTYAGIHTAMRQHSAQMAFANRLVEVAAAVGLPPLMVGTAGREGSADTCLPKLHQLDSMFRRCPSSLRESVLVPQLSKPADSPIPAGASKEATVSSGCVNNHAVVAGGISDDDVCCEGRENCCLRYTSLTRRGVSRSPIPEPSRRNQESDPPAAVIKKIASAFSGEPASFVAGASLAASESGSAFTGGARSIGNSLCFGIDGRAATTGLLQHRGQLAVNIVSTLPFPGHIRHRKFAAYDSTSGPQLVAPAEFSSLAEVLCGAARTKPRLQIAQLNATLPTGRNSNS